MTREEFLNLYKKFQDGICSPEEIKILQAWQDNIQLQEGGWEKDLGDEKEIKARIVSRLNASMGRAAVRHMPVHRRRKARDKRARMIRIIGLAAALLALVALPALLLTRHPVTIQPISRALPPTTDIKPGGNKAYLTMAGGKTIVLSDAQLGSIARQGGVQITKAKDGMVVYQFGDPGSATASGSNPADLAASGDVPVEYNTITTPRGGQYQLVLADGTKVWLNAASSLQFPVAFKGKERQVTLNGEAYFEIAKDANRPFFVQAGGTRVQVLGTNFNVSAYSDDESVITTLLDGSVRLLKGDATALLTPGQQGIAINTEHTFQVHRADLKQVMAWKDNYFYFRNTDIRTIMKQMSRWYDVDFVYEQTLKDQVFGGKISKYKDISELLRNLELTGTIHFKIQGRRVIVMP